MILLPEGESLRDTLSRVLPYYINEILPLLLQEKRILVVSHGNSLRALMSVIDKVKSDQVNDIQVPTARPIIYEISKDSTVLSKIRS
jgi:2,3-bisphosphoglycerate-dependent phosphoglycerate mutase